MDTQANTEGTSAPAQGGGTGTSGSSPNPAPSGRDHVTPGSQGNPPNEATAAQNGGVSDRRGLLDIKITLSNPNPTAGSEFTVYVEITNLFDVPIWPESPQVFLPSELQPVSRARSLGESVKSVSVLLQQAADGTLPPRQNLREPTLTWRQRHFPRLFKAPPASNAVEESLKSLASKALELDEELDKAEKRRQALKQQIDDATRGKSPVEKLASMNTDEALQELMLQLSEASKETESIRQRIARLTDQVVLLTGASAIISEGDLKLSNFTVRNQLYIRAKGAVTLDSPIETRMEALDSSLRPTDALQPGNTAVYSVALTTRGWLWFRPIQYQLEYSVNFAFDAEHSRTHTNAARQLLTIRAPIYAIMLGAFLGSTAGWIAHFLQRPKSTMQVGTVGSAWPELLLSMILGPIAIVFLARKSDAPSMLTVEDFWGGVVVGFLIGYTGSVAFQQFVPGTGAAPGAVTHQGTNVLQGTNAVR